jgi:hypothetical protein
VNPFIQTIFDREDKMTALVSAWSFPRFWIEMTDLLSARIERRNNLTRQALAALDLSGLGAKLIS